MTKYQPLGDHLTSSRLAKVTMSFREIEDALGFPLPRSARLYPAWWANERSGSHSHARSWLNANYQTVDLDIGRARVTFVRG